MVWDLGWWNKKLLNGKRSAAASVAERGVSSATASPGTTPTDMETASSEGSSTSEPLCPPPPPPAPLPDPAAPGALEEVPGPPDPNVQLTLEGFTLDEVLLANSPLLPYLSAYLDFALSAPGVQRHRFTRELFALSRQLTSAVFGRTARRAHRYRIVDLATVRRIAWLCLSQEELVLPEPEVDEDFRQRPAYQEGYLTDPPDLSVYDQKSEERNEQHQDEENQDDQPF